MPPLPPDVWRRLEPAIDALLDAPPDRRAALLATLSGGDDARRAALERMVAECERAAPLLDGSAATRFAATRFAATRFAALGGTPAAPIPEVVAGRYRVIRELARGGMATVYVAHDIRHRREVAVKVLRPELAAVLGPERFLREIELTASLQHPHILPLFDSGEIDGSLFYVMPLVAGESLRARLARERQLPLGDALRIAAEVADALAYAHGRGVVHRDVKPENILLQSAPAKAGGHALVADFGIALAVRQAGAERITHAGLSLGTPEYMAPEQVEDVGPIDSRTDVYALGAVLHEMLVGEPPFTGPTTHAVVTKMLRERPASLARARATVPPHVDAAVLTALEKLPADRFASAEAFASALRAPAPHAPAPHAAAMRHRSRRGVAVAAVAIGALALGATLDRATGRPRGAGIGATPAPVRFTIDPDSGFLWVTPPAISPDGRTVVYAREGVDGRRLYARRLDEIAARPLAGTDDGDWPFFSPDGAWVGYFGHGAIRKVPLGGGPPVLVAEVPRNEQFWGASWGADGSILYAVMHAGTLYRTPAAGGATSRVPVADTTQRIIQPQILPEGRAALVTTSPDGRVCRMAVLDLATGRLRDLGPGIAPHYVDGAIVYADRVGDVYRQGFDAGRLTPSGPATRIASGLDVLWPQFARFDVSATGVLVYHFSPRGGWRLTLTDRTGRELQVVPARAPWVPRFSPDGRRIAYGATMPDRDSSDVWIADLGADTATAQRVTTHGTGSDPQWSPDATSLAYSSNEAGDKDVFTRRLSGGPARALVHRPGWQIPTDWLRDGSAVLFTEARGEWDVWVQPTTPGAAARPLLTTPGAQSGARVSRDGRWVAYQSDETGRDEVYVDSYPTPGRKTLVSIGGGVDPVWGPDGRELYYWQVDRLIAAHVAGPIAGRAGAPLLVRGRSVLFRAPYVMNLLTANYDVSPDGTRFALVTGGPRADRLVVVLDALGAGRR